MGFKKLPIHKIHNNTTYNMPELAAVLNVCTATIWNYVQRGMPVLNKESKPWYFEGYVVKKYLDERRKSQCVKMQVHEIYCVKCRKPAEVIAESIKLYFIGYLDKNKFIRSIRIAGKCIYCETTISRFSTDDRLYDFLDYYMIIDIEIIESKTQPKTRRMGIYDPNERESK